MPLSGRPSRITLAISRSALVGQDERRSATDSGPVLPPRASEPWQKPQRDAEEAFAAIDCGLVLFTAGRAAKSAARRGWRGAGRTRRRLTGTRSRRRLRRRGGRLLLERSRVAFWSLSYDPDCGADEHQHQGRRGGIQHLRHHSRSHLGQGCPATAPSRLLVPIEMPQNFRGDRANL